VEVLQDTAAAAWLCPQCGHGSPEPRDERAHLDAHRQLQAFFEEWDAGTAPEPVAPARSRSVLYAACALAVLAVWSLTVFSHVNRADDALRAAPAPAAAPAAHQPSEPRQVTPPPAVTNEVPPAPPTATRSGSSLSSPAPARPPAVASSEAAIAISPPGVPAAATGNAAPTSSAPPADAPVVLPPAPQHLVSLCLLDICLTVL
jgi:hypothetical protein